MMIFCEGGLAGRYATRVFMFLSDRSSIAAAEGSVLLWGREFLLGSGVFGRYCCLI